MKTYLYMKNLIEKKHYPDKETVMERLDTFLMMGRLTPDEYQELAVMAAEKYAVDNQPEASA